ncbi:MAG: hypothetical protein IT233_12865 [Bacteroidia bacterium]|nr:hypothetical protein [Bacteroidia bacterium]
MRKLFTLLVWMVLTGIAAQSQTTGGPLYSIKLKEAGGVFFFEGKLKYKEHTIEAYFVFDTGTETVVLSRELSDKVGYSEDSYFSVEISDKKTTGINAVIEKEPSVHAGMSGQFGGKIYGGKIGLYPVFRNNYLIVDFKKSSIDVYTTKGGASNIGSDAAIDAKVAGSMFYSSITVNGKDGLYFSFSSGVSGSHIVSKYGAKKGKIKNNSRRSVQVGEYTQNDQLFTVIKGKDFSTEDTKSMKFKVCGTIGIDYMRNYQWHFDCMNRKMGVKKV